MKDLLIDELKTCAQYFLIMLIAATLAGWAYENSLSGRLQEGAQQGDTMAAININSIVSNLWNNYFRWRIGVFIGLSLVRLLIVVLVRMPATRY